MKKVKSQNGMTLSETLMAVLIMSLVTLAIAAGVTAGMRVYTRIKVKSEAQTMLSTNVAALSEYFEKQYVKSISTPSDTVDILFSDTSDTTLHIYNNGSDGIYVEYLDSNILPDSNQEAGQNGSKNADDNVDAQPLVSEKSNTSGLYAQLSNVTTDGKTTTFTVRILDQSNKEAEKAEDVVVRNMVQYPAEQ